MTAVNQHSRFPGTSLAYITVGGMLAVLSGTSYFFFGTDGHAVLGYLRAVALIGGVGMIVLGFCVGYIGRAARQADIAPQAPGSTTAPRAASPVASAPANGQPGSAPMVAAAAKPHQ